MLFEQANKAFLLEMMVGRESFGQAAFTHGDETDCVAKGITLVRPSLKQRNGRRVQLFFNP
jgi:hypothetical protein